MSAHPITIRFATPEDLAFIGQRGEVAPDVLGRKIEWQEIIVAERAGHLIGQARIEYLWSKIPYLALIWVAEDQRRNGASRALLGFIEEFLRKRGHEILYSSSQADEPSPQAWHRRMGFEECGFVAGINRDGVGEVFFRKRLGEAAGKP